jgi:hypothetical protein
VPSKAAATPLPLLVTVLVLTVGPLIALSQVIAYWRTDVVDDQMFGYYGWRIANGATVYLDVWDNKPPGIYWMNALGMLLGGGSYFGVIAVCVGALVVAHAAFFSIGASLWNRGAAALSTVFLSFYLTHAYYTGGTNRTETFLVAFELAAVACYMRGWARDAWWKWYAAGVLCGAAFLFKQVGLVAWGAMGLHLIVLMAARQLRVGTGVRRGALLVAGAATTIGLAGAALGAQGALSEALYATFGFNRLYFGASASQFPYNFANWVLLTDHMKPVLLLPLILAIAAVLHSFLWWLRPDYRPIDIAGALRDQRPVCPWYMFLFVVWFVVALYGALLSPHGFRHYLVPTIPPLALLCGYLLNVLRAETRLLRRVQQRAFVLTAFVVIGYLSWEALERQFEEVAKVWNFRIDPWLLAHGYYPRDTRGIGAYDDAHWEAVGDAVIRHSQPGDTIQCWGYMPGVYLHARRINTARYTTTEKPGQIGPAAGYILREMEAALRATPPVVITIQNEDYLWLHDRSPRGLPTDVHLGPWLDEHYTRVEEIPKFETVYVYKRNDQVTEAERAAAPPVAPLPESRPAVRS